MNFDEAFIYEVKPNKRDAISRGMRQIDRYVKAASRGFKREFSAGPEFGGVPT